MQNMFIVRTVLLLFICLQGADCLAESKSQHKFHHPKAFVKSLQQAKNPGKRIYQAFCAICHAIKPIIPANAPKFRHLKDWQPRLKQQQGDLFKHVDQGLGVMPARGGCFECSDKDLLAAIKFMLPQNNS